MNSGYVGFSRSVRSKAAIEDFEMPLSLINKKTIRDFLIKAHPNSELSKFINAYKSVSSRLIKKDFPHVRKKLWKEMFWSKSFCLLTTGGAPIDTIKKYIENQGQK